MASPAVNGAVQTPPELPEEVNKPPEGVILPPKDIKVIVEKTAGFVARNGHVFEDRVREKEKNNPKFSFLNAGDAYAPFYSWRLDEIKAGRGTNVSAGRAGEPAVEAEPEPPKGPDAPPEFHFAARMPNMNALDLEVVKLTALFVAKRGKSFMTALSQRETRNYQFDFLRPQHSLYQFFTRLVDQYKELLQIDEIDGGKAEKQRLAELEKNMKQKSHILERAKQRAEWVKFQEQQKQKKEEEEEEDKLAYAQIDWHDFVVVETVIFTESDDQADLPPPSSLNDLQTASLEQKAMMSLQPHDRRIEEAMPTEEDASYYNAYPHPAEAAVTQPQRPLSTGPSMDYANQQQQPSTYPSQTTTPIPASPSVPVSAAAEEEELLIRERAEARDRAHAAQAAARGVPMPPPGSTAQPPPMRIRSDYVPRAQAKRLTNTTQPTAVCPNCRQQIPIAEMEHHMRIELQDPRWKEQRAKADARFATTNLSTADVASNLKRLASQRSDVFEPAVTPAGANAAPNDGMRDGAGTYNSEEDSRRKRLATGSGPDAMSMSMPMQMPMPTTVPAPGSIPAYDPTNQAPGVGPGPSPDNPTVQQPQQPPPAPAHPVDINEQIRKIHQKFKQ